MNKKFLIAAGLVLTIGAGATLVFKRYLASGDSLPAVTEKDLAKAARLRDADVSLPAQSSLVRAIPISQPLRLAIGSLGLANDTQNREVADLITAGLTGAKGLELVDRQSLDRVLQEIEMNLSGLVRAKDAIRAGKLLRADWFLLGTPMHSKNTNTVIVRIVDARTGIFRDTAALSSDDGAQKLAPQLAAFVRKCRTDVATAKAP